MDSSQTSTLSILYFQLINTGTFLTMTFHFFPLRNKCNSAVLLTLLGMLCGFMAIALLFSDQRNASIIALLTGFMMDRLDGYWARKKNIASEFGHHLDNNSDLVLYLIYPMCYWGVQLQWAPGAITAISLFAITGSLWMAQSYESENLGISFGIPCSLLLIIDFIFLDLLKIDLVNIHYLIILLSVLFWLSGFPIHIKSIVGKFTIMMMIVIFINKVIICAY